MARLEHNEDVAHGDNGATPPDKAWRKLAREEIDARQSELGGLAVSYFSALDKKRTAAQKATVNLKETRERMEDLARQVEHGYELVAAQLTFSDAAKTRRTVQRGTRPTADAVAQE